MGEPAGEEEVLMNPFFRFSSSQLRSASSSGRDKEYSGPKEGVAPYFNGMVWSLGR